jgi:hypothetical protein
MSQGGIVQTKAPDVLAEAMKTKGEGKFWNRISE